MEVVVGGCREGEVRMGGGVMVKDEMEVEAKVGERLAGWLAGCCWLAMTTSLGARGRAK